MPGVRVGEDSMLGAQAVATHDLDPHSIVGGVPGRKIKAKKDAHRLGEHNGDGPCAELPPTD
jgi:acetyltransferase-like isoleucine patch superfamily enzyme